MLEVYEDRDQPDGLIYCVRVVGHALPIAKFGLRWQADSFVLRTERHD